MNKDYFSKRRSCRNFKPIKIGEEKIKDILSKAMKAPTCGNMQLYSIVMTDEEEQLKKLSNLHYNQPASATAPLILTICADFKRFSRWCEINNADAGYDNFHSFVMAMTDAVIIAQQIATIAEGEGFGTCYLGTVTYNASEISDLLQLPDLVVPVASLAVGIPDSLGEKTDRLPLKAICHKGKYRNLSDKEIMDFYYVHDSNPDNEKFIVENGKENLAQVFAEVRYPKKMNEDISVKFFNLLKSKAFIK